MTLLPQTSLTHAVHFNNKTTVIPPPSITKTYPTRQPSQTSTEIQLSLSSLPFGPTRRLPLGRVIHARSGDKGSDANCGFWCPSSHTASSDLAQQKYTWLRNLLSIENIKVLLGDEYDQSRRPKIEIERFELPNLKGVHFLFRNLLDRGVTSTGSIDFLGKNVAEFLRARFVDVPVRFLDDAIGIKSKL